MDITAVNVNRHRVFRHIGVIHPKTLHAARVSPLPQLFQVLFQAICHHLATRRQFRERLIRRIGNRWFLHSAESVVFIQ